MDHHLIRSIEKEGNCVYCNEKLDSDWESVFEQKLHYKCVICKCGRENCMKVDFIGTGHDSWSGLETTVRESSSIKVTEARIRILK